MQALEYNMNSMSKAASPLEDYQSRVSCDLCKASLVTPDFILENKQFRKVLEFIATEVCVKMGIEGGERSVCKGGVDLMAESLLPALAEGILSP